MPQTFGALGALIQPWGRPEGVITGEIVTVAPMVVVSFLSPTLGPGSTVT